MQPLKGLRRNRFVKQRPLRYRYLIMQKRHQIAFALLLACASPTFADDELWGDNVKWRASIPQAAVSASGLPVGKLTAALQARDLKAARNFLANCPQTPANAEERALWQAACLVGEKRLEEAVAIFSKARSLPQAPLYIQYCAARAFSAEGAQLDQAIKYSSAVLAKYTLVPMLEVRAGCYSAQNKIELAARDFVTIGEVSKFSAKTYYVKAAGLYVKAGKYKEATDLLDKAAKARGGEGDVGITMVRADCYKYQNKLPQAVEALTLAIKQGREKKGEKVKYMVQTCLKERAQIYEKLGKKDLAKADLKAVDAGSLEIEDILGVH